MIKQAHIDRIDSLLVLSSDGERPIDDKELLYELTRKLQFTKVNLKFAGKFSREFKTCALYALDDQNRIVCQVGWLDAICRLLNKHGYAVDLCDKSSPLPRPDCYEEDWEGLERNFQFRPAQKECIVAISERISKRLGGVVEAPTAFGKTKVISMICTLYPKAKIDVVTSGLELIHDLRRHLLTVTPEVGVIGGGGKDERRITVVSDKSMAYSNFEADIVLVDEVHKMMTDRSAGLLSRYKHACMFGFTATKETRIDNAHRRMEGIFGPTIFKIDWKKAVELGLIVPVQVIWIPVNLGTLVSRYYESVIRRKRFGYWRNLERNQAIAKVARAFYQEGFQTLILVETVEHLLYLHELLPEFAICYGSLELSGRKLEMFRRRGLLKDVHPLTQRDRMQLKARFEQQDLMGAIATPIWTHGVSFDALQVLIRADGGDSMTNNYQWPGRVTRIDPKTGKSYGIVVDFEDLFDPWALARSRRRRQAYAKAAWNQKTIGRQADQAEDDESRSYSENRTSGG